MNQKELKEKYQQFIKQNGLRNNQFVITGECAKNVVDQVEWMRGRHITVAVHPAVFWVLAERVFNGILEGHVNESKAAGDGLIRTSCFDIHNKQSVFNEGNYVVVDGDIWTAPTTS